MGSTPSSARNQISPKESAWSWHQTHYKDVTDLPDPDSLQFPEFGLDEAERRCVNGFDYIVVSNKFNLQIANVQDSFTHRSLKRD